MIIAKIWIATEMTAATLRFFGKILCCPPMVNSPKGKPQANDDPSRVKLKYVAAKTTKIKFSVGDKVRVSVYKGVFTKGYLPNWSTEIFTIIKVNKT